MDAIIDGVLRFQREVYPQNEALYRKLSQGQSPTALFIGCSDSRVVPEQLTQQGPGSLFVVRNAGNIVPPPSAMPDGVAASIEYAVAVLQVPNIIVCGHSGCGAMSAMLSGDGSLAGLPAVAQWLRYADAAREIVLAEHSDSTPDQRLTALVQENVLMQLRHVAAYPFAAKALEEKRLRLHGWVYDIGEGMVNVYDARTSRFTTLGEGPSAHAVPLT